MTTQPHASGRGRLVPGSDADLIEKLKSAPFYHTYQNAFRAATGLPLLLVSADQPAFNPFHASANQNPFCRALNAGSTPCSQCVLAQCSALAGRSEGTRSIECFAGMKESAIPLKLGVRVVGYLRTGQVFTTKPSAAIIAEVVESLRSAGRHDSQIEELLRLYELTPVFSSERYASMMTLLSAFGLQLMALANQILLESRGIEPETVQRAKQYIAEQIDNKIYLDAVAAAVNVSTFYLCKIFKQSTGMTLRERAEALLDAPVADFSSIPPGELLRLIHELQIHQVELEIQNQELREAQIEIAHVRDRYSELYDSAPVGYATLDSRGVITRANLTCATMLGLARNSLPGNSLSDFLAERSQDQWHIYRRRLLSGDAPPPCELVMRSSGEQRMVIQVHGAGIRDHDGQSGTFAVALADVTERQAAQEILTELNIGPEQFLSGNRRELKRTIEQIGLLSAALSSLGEGVLITEGDCAWSRQTVVFVNSALSQITGYSAEELVGKTPRALHGLATAAGTVRKIDDTLSEDHPLHCELANYRNDGTCYDAEIWVNPIQVPRGKDGARSRRHICILRDITQRKQAERDMQKLNQFNRRLFETAQNILLILDPDGRIIDFNPAFEKLIGWSIVEVRGKDWFEHFLPQRDRPQIRQRFSNAIRGKPTRGKANAVVTRDSTERIIEWYDSKLVDQEGKLTGLLCSGTDITDRRRLEQAAINAAEEERQRLARDLHDELGSLLTSISIRSGALAKSLSAGAAPGLAEDSVTISRQIQLAIDKTRAISAGLFPVGAHPDDLVVSLARLSADTTASGNISCRFDCPVPIAIDDQIVANHLFRIAQEAVNNAVKYSGAKEIVVSLAKDSDRLILQIADDGGGFDLPEQRSAGLGLHIMAYRASAIGASLKIAAAPGGGTCVTCIR